MGDVKCLACGCVFDRAMEMCPRRYLSPHDAKAMEKAARKEIEKDLQDLRQRIGVGPTRSLQTTGVYKVWRRSSPWNEWVESKRGDQLWHSGEGIRQPDRRMFELAEDSEVRVGDGLPAMARMVIGREWDKPELSIYRLKEEYRP
jgi:hypothetical protein